MGRCFSSPFYPPPALVELQRCKSNRIQSFWQKAECFSLGIPWSFWGVQKHLTLWHPGDAVMGRVWIQGGPGELGLSLLQALCCVCQVNPCCWLAGMPWCSSGFKGKAELGQVELAGGSQRGSGPWQPVVRIRAPVTPHQPAQEGAETEAGMSTSSSQPEFPSQFVVYFSLWSSSLWNSWVWSWEQTVPVLRAECSGPCTSPGAFPSPLQVLDLQQEHRPLLF